MGSLKEDDDDVMCSTIWILVLFQRNLTPTCVFWDVASHPGKWNASGCEVVKEEHQTTCLCDHLTFFAVLMVSILQMLQILISYCSSELPTTKKRSPMLFLLLRKKQRDHIVYVHMNLLWAIFLLDMSFLIAVPLAPTGGDTACKAGGMFLHFGMLSCLTWMAIEGYSLYRLVIEVFNSYVKNLLLKLCLVGWGEWQKLWGNKWVGFDRFGSTFFNFLLFLDFIPKVPFSGGNWTFWFFFEDVSLLIQETSSAPSSCLSCPCWSLILRRKTNS
uniref:Uncharacterized protein n=1 Tax=Laticauda laticaudata TaxID=8630 RepID=A0A8C5SMY6_LATLA